MDFEAYNRTALPLLVEANLQAVVSVDMAPMEESLKALLVDIVRRCQSTVAQNFQRLQGPKVSPNRSIGSTPQILPSTQPAALPLVAANHALGFYQEPPYLTAEAGASSPGPPLEDESHRATSQGQVSDSGYGSGTGPDACECPCHLGDNPETLPFGKILDAPQRQRLTATGLENCDSCTLTHFNFECFSNFNADSSWSS